MRGPTQLGARRAEEEEDGVMARRGALDRDGATGERASERWLLCGPLSKALRALSTAGRLISPRYFALTAANAWNIGAAASVIPYRNAA